VASAQKGPYRGAGCSSRGPRGGCRRAGSGCRRPSTCRRACSGSRAARAGSAPPWMASLVRRRLGGGEGLSRIECFSFGERGRGGKRRKTRRTVLGFMGRKFEGKGPRFDGKGRRKNFRRRVAVTGAETGCAWILYGKRSSVPTS
jgi:hypothetical protein